MIDISLAFDPEIFAFDLALEGDPDRDLRGDDGLLTAVIISLFTDARANADDPLPDERIGLLSDPRGWWGDYILEEDSRDPIRNGGPLHNGGPMGSRLWLLSREKDMDVVVARAQQYADEAVAWLLRDKHVDRVSTVASRVSRGYLGIAVAALEPTGGMDAKTREWNFLYDYENARPVKIEAPGL